MSVTKELIEQVEYLVKTGQIRDMYLHKEGTFLRAYDWSAWLCCRYLHDFKASKRQFKGIDEAVAYISFPSSGVGQIPCQPDAQKGHCHPPVAAIICPVGQSGWHRACSKGLYCAGNALVIVMRKKK